MLGDNPFNEPNNLELGFFIQANPHLDLFKLPNILFYLQILWVERADLEVEFLFVRGRNLLSICFLSLDHVLILDLASLALLFFRCSYYNEAYPFILRMAN